MKTFIFIALLTCGLSEALSQNACPNLEGVYTCFQNNQSFPSVIHLTVQNNITTYEVLSEDETSILIADGIAREISIDTHMTVSCKNNVLNIHVLRLVKNENTITESEETSTDASLTNYGFIANGVSTLTQNGGNTLTSHFENKCRRLNKAQTLHEL